MPGITGKHEDGPNLKALIAGKCVPKASLTGFTPEQRTAIERLTDDQIKTLIEVRRLVGPVGGCEII